jgi:hypothetical protein
MAVDGDAAFAQIGVPQMMLIRMVLPAPFGPGSAKISPRLIRVDAVERLEAGAIGLDRLRRK